MKKILLSYLLCLPMLFLAQTNKQNVNTKSKSLATKVEEKKKKPTVVAGTDEYYTLKAQNKLGAYAIIVDNSEAVQLQMPINNAGAKVAALTPCDLPPYIGVNPYLPSATAIDDNGKLINLPFSFCFYGVNYTSMRVFDNGNVQFSTNSTAFTSTGFPSATVNMIAPFWGDGKLNNLVGGLRYGKVLVDLSTPTRVTVSWDSLPYYQATVADVSKLNSFQLVLTNGLDPILPGGKNVGFYFKKMQWTTGNASGGTNGFPTTQPGNPSTVGANQGNGVDYFQMGRFGVPGSAYDGPLGNNDGVSWLDGKKFFFNVCPAVGANFEPVSALLGYCDTVKVCGNDTIFVKNTFLAPEAGQTVTITANAPTLGTAFSYSTNSNPNGGSDIFIIVNANGATGGYHTINIFATDNGVPALTNAQQITVFIDQTTVNNLNGNIVITPTLGACPGGVVSASVTLVGGTAGSYLWSNGLTGSTTTFTTVIAADSLVFVTIKSGQCSKTIVGDININPTPVVAISGNTSFCSGDASSTLLTANNTLNPSSQAPYSYVWAVTSGSISSTTSQSVTVKQGIYTVTVTNQFGCKSAATTTVTLKESPAYTLTSTNAVSGGSVYCVNQDTARISINFGLGGAASCGLANTPCSVTNPVQIGFATTEGSASDYTPFNGLWESAKHQYLIRASELTAAGLQGGKLSSLSFGITNLNGNNNIFENFNIKLKCVNYNVVGTAMDNVGLTQVYGPATISVNTGVNTYNFIQPYLWDGVSNILIDLCWFNPNWDGNLSVQYTNVGYNATLSRDDDGINQCPISQVDYTSQIRPNFGFENCLAQQTGSQFNVVVTPSTGVVIPAAHTGINIKLPSTSGSTCYTVSLVNPLGGCSKDTIICVQANQGITQATLVASSYSVCPAETFTLSAQGALNSYTIQYVDNLGALGSSINSSVAITAPTTVGAYTYTLLATGACGGTLTAFTNTVNVIKGVTIATLVATPSVVCIGQPINLSSNGSLATYTITYNNGSVINSINNPATFNSTIPGVNIFSLTAQGFCSGPITTFTASVLVNNFINLNIAPIPNVTKCLNGTAVLSANVASSAAQPYTYSWSPSTGVNTNSTYTTNTPVITTYTLIVNGFCANTASTTVVVNNFSSNINVVIPDSATICSEKVLVLNSITTGGKAPYTYNWTIMPNANSLSNTSVLNTTAPAAQGIYTVMVTSTDSCGFTGSDMQLIVVLPPCGLEIGNIITPNGDGANDLFKIKNIENYPNSVLTIFDRWGRKVYDNPNYANEWNASGLHDGTYFYVLDVPNDKKYNGFVQVLR